MLNTKPRYKRERPSHFRQHLISILIKSCSERGRSDLLPKELQNKKACRCKAVRTLMYFTLNESLARSCLDFLLVISHTIANVYLNFMAFELNEMSV